MGCNPDQINAEVSCFEPLAVFILNNHLYTLCSPYTIKHSEKAIQNGLVSGEFCGFLEVIGVKIRIGH